MSGARVDTLLGAALIVVVLGVSALQAAQPRADRGRRGARRRSGGGRAALLGTRRRRERRAGRRHDRAALGGNERRYRAGAGAHRGRRQREGGHAPQCDATRCSSPPRTAARPSSGRCSAPAPTRMPPTQWHDGAHAGRRCRAMPKAMRVLVQHGADVNARDRHGADGPDVRGRPQPARGDCGAGAAGAAMARPRARPSTSPSFRQVGPPAPGAGAGRARTPAGRRASIGPFIFNELVGSDGRADGAAFRRARRATSMRPGRSSTAGADVNQLGGGDETHAAPHRRDQRPIRHSRSCSSSRAPMSTARAPAGVTPLYAALNVQWAPKSMYPQPRAHTATAVWLSRVHEAPARERR